MPRSGNGDYNKKNRRPTSLATRQRGFAKKNKGIPLQTPKGDFIQCPQCPHKVSYVRSANMDRHLVNHHGVKPFICSRYDCSEEFKKKAEHSEHCKKGHAHLPVLPEHLRRTNYKVTCKDCFNPSIAKSEKHIEAHKNIVSCPDCHQPYLFTNNANLFRHIKKFHPNLNFPTKISDYKKQEKARDRKEAHENSSAQENFAPVAMDTSKDSIKPEEESSKLILNANVGVAEDSSKFADATPVQSLSALKHGKMSDLLMLQYKPEN